MSSQKYIKTLASLTGVSFLYCSNHYILLQTSMSQTLSTSFGTFKGRKGDGVTQYRGIRYACVRDQLSVPELVTEYGTIDATRYGYVFHIPCENQC